MTRDKSAAAPANSIAGAFEFAQKKQLLPDFMPSRLFIYYNERVIEHTTGKDAGAQIRDGIKTVAKQGVPAGNRLALQREHVGRHRETE